ncbi:glucan biosynthesis protein G [Phytopseudomonas dryadis]|uniref:Glucans biosynthesis protein G n=1 Tax=Phytopseudomonas dryadis TaxID=2487520 RepID=A0A4Q9QUZ6_9GAMM|nr:glucan biosynthesis protein G [Pseudomonas dryadis]TBV07827.1 glucan biosynthesis protein G [Pseudomonas dryadis]TBV19222.1 glucan biosynthesis protein G [Pseudomonas sp. FRB 230]
MLPAALCLVCMASLFGAAQAQAFSLDDVAARAKELWEKPFVAPTSNLPTEFRELQFADYQKITSREDKYEWHDRKTPFKLSFYHQGMHFDTPVKLNEVTATSVREIEYDPERFDFGDLKISEDADSKLGYAGFRVMYPINVKGQSDEIMSLLGASYFRVIGKDQVYGLSARGLAMDTALPSGEEFPYFREFWIERPKPEDKHLVIFALLDSPRATGAYRFILRPGKDAVVDVQSRVFLRDNVNKLGIAPLTSMYLYGPNQYPSKPNYRPALHDSNGLAIHTGSDERIWRPLNNPQNLAVSTFQVDNPKGFGLLQRGRDFSQYEDLEDRYEQRPSAWIEPKGEWGKGKIELVEIPTPDETNDNIVAFWSPDEQPKPGEPMQFDYRMRWTLDEPALLDEHTAWVKQTMRSPGEVKQANLIRKLDGSTALLVDFQGPVLAELPADAAVTSQVSVSDNAELLDNVLQYNPQTKGWRLTLRLNVKDPKQPVEMRAALVEGDKTLSETWSYQLPPNTVTAQ